MSNLHEVAFWATVVLAILGAILGLAGVWVPGFRYSELSGQLIMSDIILAATALILAVITKWLW